MRIRVLKNYCGPAGNQTAGGFLDVDDASALTLIKAGVAEPAGPHAVRCNLNEGDPVKQLERAKAAEREAQHAHDLATARDRREAELVAKNESLAAELADLKAAVASLKAGA